MVNSGDTTFQVFGNTQSAIHFAYLTILLFEGDSDKFAVALSNKGGEGERY
jgi:hypothetical protein